MPKDASKLGHRGIGFVTFASPDTVEQVFLTCFCPAMFFCKLQQFVSRCSRTSVFKHSLILGCCKHSWIYLHECCKDVVSVGVHLRSDGNSCRAAQSLREC